MSRVAKPPAERTSVSASDAAAQLSARFQRTPAAAPEKGAQAESPPAQPETPSAEKPTEQPKAPPEPKVEPAGADLKHVPFDRFKEVNDRMKAAEAAAAEREASLQAAQERLAQLEQDAKSRRVTDLLDRVKTGKSEVDADEVLTLIDTITEEKLGTVQKTMQEMAAQSAISEQLAEYGMTRDQRAAVMGLMKEKGLEIDEAVALAQWKRTDLFPQQDQRSFNPAQHGLQRPGRAGPQPQPTPMDRVRNAQTPRDRLAAAQEMVRSRLVRRDVS